MADKHDRYSGEQAEKSAARFRGKDAYRARTNIGRKLAGGLARACGFRDSFRVAPGNISRNHVEFGRVSGGEKTSAEDGGFYLRRRWCETQFPDSRQVMVVVFGEEIQMVHQAH